MTLAKARARDAHEGRVLLERLDIGAARVAHRGTQAADNLVNDVGDRSFVRHLPFDALGNELERIGHFGLEVAVGAAARHRAHRAHAAITLLRPALIEEDLARRLFGTGEQ